MSEKQPNFQYISIEGSYFVFLTQISFPEVILDW